MVQSSLFMASQDMMQVTTYVLLRGRMDKLSPERSYYILIPVSSCFSFLRITKDFCDVPWLFEEQYEIAVALYFRL